MAALSYTGGMKGLFYCSRNGWQVLHIETIDDETLLSNQGISKGGQPGQNA